MTEKKKQGGARPGAGRPKGTTNKLSVKTLLNAISEKCGDTFENLVAQGYLDSITSKDTSLRFQYERMIVSKVVLEAGQEEMIDGLQKTQGFSITFIKPTPDSEDDE